MNRHKRHIKLISIFSIVVASIVFIAPSCKDDKVHQLDCEEWQKLDEYVETRLSPIFAQESIKFKLSDHEGSAIKIFLRSNLSYDTLHFINRSVATSSTCINLKSLHIPRTLATYYSNDGLDSFELQMFHDDFLNRFLIKIGNLYMFHGDSHCWFCDYKDSTLVLTTGTFIDCHHLEDGLNKIGNTNSDYNYFDKYGSLQSSNHPKGKNVAFFNLEHGLALIKLNIGDTSQKVWERIID